MWNMHCKYISFDEGCRYAHGLAWTAALPRPKLSNYHIGTHFKLFLNSLMKRLQLGGARIGDDGKAAVLLKYYLHVLLNCDDVM